ALLLTYDENDCFFDHMPPPAPPGAAGGGSTADTAGEYHQARGGPSAGTPDDPRALHGRAYGLGPRVPMLVVSPFSRGGWLDARVYDHTSVIRLLESRFGV
ncbi:phospholipase C, phosphocholine-specific, partial [Cronobacter sakazakii]